MFIHSPQLYDVVFAMKNKEIRVKNGALGNKHIYSDFTE